MDKTYKFTQKTNFEIQRIIENMFLIKILKKDREEISNFHDTIKNANFNELKNHKYGAINSFLPSFITMFVFSILLSSFLCCLSICFVFFLFLFFD